MLRKVGKDDKWHFWQRSEPLVPFLEAALQSSKCKTYRRGRAAGFESRGGWRGWGSRGSVGVREPRERTCDWLENLQIFLEKKEAKHRKKVTSNMLQCNHYSMKPRDLFENVKCPLSGERHMNRNLNKQSRVALCHVCSPASLSCLSLFLCELAKGSVA